VAGTADDAELHYDLNAETRIEGTVAGTNDVSGPSPLDGIHLLVVAKG